MKVGKVLDDIKDMEGILSRIKPILANDFIQEVKEHLSGNLKEDFTQRGNWKLDIEPYDGNLSFKREVWIGKYADEYLPPFIDEDEDGPLPLKRDSEVYKKALSEYRKPLRICTEHKVEENFVTRRDNWFYRQSVFVPLKKPLTMEYAEEIADMISGKEKEKDVYDESEEQER